MAVVRSNLSSLDANLLHSFNVGTPVPSTKVQGNDDTLRGKVNTVTQYCIDDSASLTETNSFSGSNTFTTNTIFSHTDGIDTNKISTVNTNDNLVIIPLGTGKIYRDSVTADNEIPTLSEATASSSSSATAAASSASSASTSATNAATSATNAATSETNAATSETNAATSETNAATSASNAAAYAAKIASIIIFSDATTVTTGDGAGDIFFRVPTALDGFNLTSVAANVFTAGTTGTTDIQIHNITQTADMLSTKITIDSGEKDSSTAATPAVIDTGNDDVAEGDQIRIDVDAVSTTPPVGLVVELQFDAP